MVVKFKGRPGKVRRPGKRAVGAVEVCCSTAHLVHLSPLKVMGAAITGVMAVMAGCS